MKTGISLTELAAKIEGNRALKADYVASTEHATMRVDADRTALLELPNVGRFPIQSIAHRQIAAHTGVPAAYYDRMTKEAPSLLAENVNTWFHVNPARRMVRTLGGDMRAFLSDRYQRIEHEEMAEVALPILANEPGIRITSCEVTDRRLYIHAVTSRIQREVKVGDFVEAGVLIQNSEIGLGSVSVQTLAYRLACLNGMKLPDGAYRRNHVGRRVEEGEDLNEIWADDTRKADDRAVLLKVRDMVRMSLDESRFAAQVDKMKALADPAARVTGLPETAVTLLAAKVGATEAERGGILRSLIEGGDLSAWGLLNAVTAQAHSASSYDRAVEFEAAGGQLLNLPKTEWRQILEAA